MKKPVKYYDHSLFDCAGSRKTGSWWFRVFGYGLHLRAPWNEPLFAERNGYERYLRFRGWRLRHLLPPPRY